MASQRICSGSNHMIKLLRDFSAYDKIIDTQTQFSCKIAGQISCKQLFRLYQMSYYDTSPVGIYLLKVNNRNTRARCQLCSKLTIKTSERRHWRRSGVFIVNFEHKSPCSSISIVNFEHIFAGWEDLFVCSGAFKLIQNFNDVVRSKGNIHGLLSLPALTETFFCMCDALRDLGPFVQFTKRENTHGRVLLLVNLKAFGKWYQIAQNIRIYYNNIYFQDIEENENREFLYHENFTITLRIVSKFSFWY